MNTNNDNSLVIPKRPNYAPSNPPKSNEMSSGGLKNSQRRLRSPKNSNVQMQQMLNKNNNAQNNPQAKARKVTLKQLNMGASQGASTENVQGMIGNLNFKNQAAMNLVSP